MTIEIIIKEYEKVDTDRRFHMYLHYRGMRSAFDRLEEETNYAHTSRAHHFKAAIRETYNNILGGVG